MAEEHPDSEEVLLGVTVVQLELGGDVHLRPWGIRSAKRMMSRIKTIFMLAFGGNTLDIAVLLDSSYDEIVAMVAATIDVEVDVLYDETKYTLTDLLALIDGIIKVNFTDRPGLIKNVQSLMGTLNMLLPQEAETETSPTESVKSEPTTSP